MTPLNEIRHMLFLHENGMSYLLVRYTLDDKDFQVLDHSGETSVFAPAEGWEDTARMVMAQQWAHVHPTTAMVGEWHFNLTRHEAAAMIAERSSDRTTVERTDDDYAMVFEAQTKWRVKQHEMGEKKDDNILLIRMPMMFTDDVMDAMLDIAGRAADNQLTDDDHANIQKISYQMRTSFMVSAIRGNYETFWMNEDDVD